MTESVPLIIALILSFAVFWKKNEYFTAVSQNKQTNKIKYIKNKKKPNSLPLFFISEKHRNTLNAFGAPWIISTTFYKQQLFGMQYFYYFLHATIVWYAIQTDMQPF